MVNINNLLSVKSFLNLEHLIMLIGLLYVYQAFEMGWLFFALCFFLPDVSMIGYLINKNIGATIYNIFHSFAFAGILILYGVIFPFELDNRFNSITLISFGIIVGCHISFDRILGFGLKYQTDFKDTHMQKL